MENDYTKRHMNDAIRIQNLLESNGYKCSIDNAFAIWDYYSDVYCASWLGLPESDEDLLNILKYYYNIIY